ncbi:MAG: hypothetical protein EOO11_11505 [Chitinophagaceae bacterium]|nr:MAG: hypothetical protein EOO11_11505 [Chitinophagaceae bacterium]
MRLSRLLFAILLPLSLTASAQDAPRVHNDVFYTDLPNTAGANPVSFSLGARTIAALRASAPYLAFSQNPAAIAPWIDRGVTDTLAMYLEERVSAAALRTKEQLNNAIVFQVVPNGRQSVTLDRKGNVVVSFTFMHDINGSSATYQRAESITDARGTSIRRF